MDTVAIKLNNRSIQVIILKVTDCVSNKYRKNNVSLGDYVDSIVRESPSIAEKIPSGNFFSHSATLPIR